MKSFDEIVDEINIACEQIRRAGYEKPEIIPHPHIDRFKAVKTDNRIYVSMYFAAVLHIELGGTYQTTFKHFGVTNDAIDAVIYHAKKQVNKTIEQHDNT